MNHKLLILIGPGKSFGLETCKCFADKGFDIALVGRSMENLNYIKNQLNNQKTFQCILLRADILYDRVNHIIDQILAIQNWEEICLIYNIKIASKGSLLDSTQSGVDQVAKANLNVPNELTKYLCDLSKKVLQKKIRFILTGGGYKDKPDSNKFYLSLSKSLIHSIYLNASYLNSSEFAVKTLVIDGEVGKNKIRSKFVAESFYNLWSDDSIFEQRIE